MSAYDTLIVEVQAKITRGSSRSEIFGWKVTFDPQEQATEIAANITDLCRRVRDEAQEKCK